MTNIRYPLLRIWAVLKKEFLQLRRDLPTLALMMTLPVAQVILFGYIVDTNPKHLPTLIVTNDYSAFTTALIQGLENTEYFDVKGKVRNEEEAEKLLKNNKIIFTITIPTDFSHDLIRGDQPHILIEGDSSDPVTTVSAFQAAQNVVKNVFDRQLQGSLGYLLPADASFKLDIHAKYNPTINSRYHTLPGLLIAILLAALVSFTAMLIVNEYESGTMESLLITPIKPLEVLLAKLILPLLIGYYLVIVILFIACWLFRLPFYGSWALLLVLTLPFLMGSLGVGMAISTFCRTQVRAVSVSSLYNLPAILLSGFVFPFYGMPLWAQAIGNVLPSTHYLRIIYSVMLKGSTFMDVLPDVWPMLVFLIVILIICIFNYRQTLD